MMNETADITVDLTGKVLLIRPYLFREWLVVRVVCDGMQELTMKERQLAHVIVKQDGTVLKSGLEVGPAHLKVEVLNQFDVPDNEVRHVVALMSDDTLQRTHLSANMDITRLDDDIAPIAKRRARVALIQRATQAEIEKRELRTGK